MVIQALVLEQRLALPAKLQIYLQNLRFTCRKHGGEPEAWQVNQQIGIWRRPRELDGKPI